MRKQISTLAAAGLLAVATAPLLADSPTTAPTAGPATRPAAGPDRVAVQSALRQDMGAFRGMFNSSKLLTDPAARAAAAPRLVPVLQKLCADFGALGAVNPQSKASADLEREQFTGLLALYGDADANARLAAEGTSPDPALAVRGQSQQLIIRWWNNTTNPAAQATVVDQAQALAAAHPDDVFLTRQLMTMTQTGPATPALAERVKGVVTDVMHNSIADAVRAQAAGGSKLLAMVGKPLALQSPALDGSTFDAAAWHGKVVLVDFWATWCGPCKAELPRVQALYNQYHDKGLEVLGVSNDLSADALKAFVAGHPEMAWPQLFTPAAAAAGKMNPLLDRFGISNIPTMFLIDRRGVLRSVTARDHLETYIPALLAETDGGPHPAGIVAPAPAAAADDGPARRAVMDVTLNDIVALRNAYQEPQLLTADGRRQIAPTVLPLVHKLDADYDASIKAAPGSKPQIENQQHDTTALAATLGDAPAAARLAGMAADPDPAVALTGNRLQLQVRWWTDAQDAAAQAKVADRVTELAKANPTDVVLTNQLIKMSGTAASPELCTRLQSLVTGVMRNPLAERAAAELADQQRLAASAGQPMAIAGQQLGGATLSTAEWRGKVVLVDFWATWCAPCKAELPRVVKMYEQYHDKGLEVLGVSNDRSGESLTRYLAANPQMAWPQLFDPSAAADGKWNPVTQTMGITGIPVMVLIDKHGVCRTVTARDGMEDLIPKLLAETN